MASRVLYPPIIDPYMPAFQAGDSSYCRVYFSLSKFNSSSDFKSLHVSIVKQSNGINVVNPRDNAMIGHYRATGIILNMKFKKVEGEDNLYYFDILNNDLSSSADGYTGWIPGWIYKIQIRLSQIDYDGSIGQAAWLNNNANLFSEWSTICTTKAIGAVKFVIPFVNYDSTEEDVSVTDQKTLYASTLELFGEFISEDKSEVLYSYNFKLYDESNKVIEDSGELYTNQYQNCNEFNFLFKTELKDAKRYTLAFNFTTQNGFYFEDKIEFLASLTLTDKINCQLLTVDNSDMMADYSSLEEENNEGRIALKLYAPEDVLFYGNVCIRRCSSKDQFKEWRDIKIITLKGKRLNDYPVIYDYSIESGVFYQYGVQSIDQDGNRGILNKTNHMIRNFEYSYLLGENEQQLKLMFDNTMQNFKIQLAETKADTVGSKYPIITRNAAMKYKTFPIAGLISFWMDENHTFCDKRVIYETGAIVDMFEKYDENNNITQYNYIYERDFRNLVLEFLHDGKPKLFKSPTEGNIIVRMMDATCTPNQSLDRMIYSFSSTAYEFAEGTYDNYLKYGYIVPGTYSSDLSDHKTKLGQLQMTFTPDVNIFEEIYKKYDTQDANYGGFRRTLTSIHHIAITFEDRPLRIKNSAGEFVMGNNLVINGKKITVINNMRKYEFDERLSYTQNDSLHLLGDEDGQFNQINATVDFLYEIDEQPYVAKRVRNKETQSGIGQYFAECKPDTSIYNEIYFKFYIEWPLYFRRLNTLSGIEIEAAPGSVFLVKDATDKTGDKHTINSTGVLRLDRLSNINQVKYLGIRDPETGEIDNTYDPINKDHNILMNYCYVINQGYYKE